MSDDSTKEKLNIDSMDMNARKDLFNKFVDAGGQVNAKPHKEKTVKAPAKRAPASTASKGSTAAKKEQTKQAAPKKPTPPPKTTNTKANSSIFNDKALKDMNTTPASKRFAFWFDAVRHGTINFVGNRVSVGLFNYITRNVLSVMVENQSTLMSALYPSDVMGEGDRHTHEEIVETFTDEEDLEILQRYTDIYVEENYKAFITLYKNAQANATAADFVDILIRMIKPIFITKNYSNRIKISAENVLIIYAKDEGMSKALLNKKLMLFKKAIDVIYGDLYDKLFALLKFASKKDINELSIMLNLLKMTEEDYVGYQTKKRKEEEKQREKEIEASKKDLGKDKDEETEKFDKMIEIGKGLIDRIVDFDKMKDNLDYIDSKDKVYRTMTLCDFLDSEYSLLFTNRYVKYNIILDDHQKIDYSTNFNDAIMAMSELSAKLNEYYSIAHSIIEITGDQDMRVNNRSVLIKERTAQLSHISRNLRSQYGNVISGLKKSFDKLMLNKEERDRIIGNPDDILSVPSSESTGGKKRISGMTVMKALTEVFYYITALSFMLSSGELSGNGMLVDDGPIGRQPIDPNDPHPQEDEPEVEKPHSEYIDENEKNDNGIIEIDDLEEQGDDVVAVLDMRNTDDDDPLIHR